MGGVAREHIAELADSGAERILQVSVEPQTRMISTSTSPVVRS